MNNSIKTVNFINTSYYRKKNISYSKTVHKNYVFQNDIVLNNLEIKLNNTQEMLYKRVLFGIKALHSDELINMHYGKKHRIKKVHSRAMKILNLYKQRIIIKKSNDILLKSFPNCKILNQFLESPEQQIDDSFIVNLTLRKLELGKKEIIDIFIFEKILPYNFYELQEENL